MDIRLKPNDVIQDGTTVIVRTFFDGNYSTGWDSEKQAKEAFDKLREYFGKHRLRSKYSSVSKALFALFPEG